MTSSLTWLDYSEKERQQVAEVISLFGEETARDELGIGVIRDTFSNALFPGTSTIQTRIRYFFFLPWLLQELESKRISSHQAAEHSRRLQGRLRDALMVTGEEEGIIGLMAGQYVQRLPTTVYWNGLGAWGIRTYPGPEAGYYQSLDGFHQRHRTNRGTNESEPEKESPLCNWDLALPPAPEGFLEETNFTLSEQEAEYLIDRIRRRAPDSLLRELVDRGATAKSDIRFPWDHPATGDLPPKPAEALFHAHNFSLMIHGASLLYNLILAEELQWEEGIEEYRGRLHEWWEATVERDPAFMVWDRDAFWSFISENGGRINPHTRGFIDYWDQHFDNAQKLEALTDNPAIRKLIADRESRLKGKRARIGNQSALESWSGASGIGQLDYRWNRPVTGYLDDIAQAFKKGGQGA